MARYSQRHIATAYLCEGIVARYSQRHIVTAYLCEGYLSFRPVKQVFIVCQIFVTQVPVRLGYDVPPPVNEWLTFRCNCLMSPSKAEVAKNTFRF